MPGIWTFFLMFALYSVVAEHIKKQNNVLAGRKEDDPLGQPGCFTPFFYVGGWILAVSFFVKAIEWLFYT